MIPKFRAWDTHEEVMNRVDYVDFVNGVMGMTNENVRDYEQPIHRVNIMQYTGLKDKNGVEIYERDIVKVTDDDGRTDFSDGGIGTVCGLEDLGVWYIDGQVHNGLFDINHCYYTEVIANVYENTELLEEQE